MRPLRSTELAGQRQKGSVVLALPLGLPTRTLPRRVCASSARKRAHARELCSNTADPRVPHSWGEEGDRGAVCTNTHSSSGAGRALALPDPRTQGRRASPPPRTRTRTHTLPPAVSNIILTQIKRHVRMSVCLNACVRGRATARRRHRDRDRERKMGVGWGQGWSCVYTPDSFFYQRAGGCERLYLRGL